MTRGNPKRQAKDSGDDGFVDLTMDEVAQRPGVNKATIYR